MQPVLLEENLALMPEHNAQDLIQIFNDTFADTYNTRLIRGRGEPIYLPADQNCDYHRIEFAHGYYASALHEISHWCIAGEQRRLLEDYGYWYCPDGRNALQQAEFEKVEIKPQALEWAFSAAAQKPFRVSTDNLNGVEPDRVAFQAKVYQQVQQYLATGFPKRGLMFIQALSEFYQTAALNEQSFYQDLPGELKYAAVI